MSDRTLPSYEEPPVVEVVFNLTFETLSAVKLPHIGLFWSDIREAFPRCQQAPTLGDLNSVIEPETGVPIPRVWFINASDDKLIQIQKNRFLFNWRKRASAYPRFGNVYKEFNDNLANFKNFLSANELGELRPRECELTYINHIPRTTNWESIADVGSVFPDVSWSNREARFLPVPEGIQWNVVFPMPDQAGALYVKLNSGATVPENTPLLVLELRARGVVTDKTEIEIGQWFRLAREWIVLGFEDLTSELVQNEFWKKT